MTIMRRTIGRTVLTALLAATGIAPVVFAAGLDLGRSGIGLRQPRPAAHLAESAVGGNAFGTWQATADGHAVYSGVRERSGALLPAQESFAGIAYTVSSSLAASLELAVSDPTAIAPRRYALAGRLHAPAGSGGLSVGLTYRLYDDRSLGMRSVPNGGAVADGYALVPVRAPGTGLGPSYQLQLQYQYSASTTFGLVLGRELETYTPAFDRAGTGLRQFSFSGQHWLTPSWALSYDLLSDDPGSLRLQGLRLGMRYRF